MSKEFTVDEIRQAIGVDKNDLDNVLVQQIDLYDYICKRYFASIDLKDAAKDEQKRVDAEALLEIRTKAEMTGAKTTESIVAALVQTHTGHIEAVQKLLVAEKEYNDWASLKDSFKNRSDMLRELGGLYSAGYFIKTAGSSQSKENYERMRAQMDRRKL